MYKRFTNIFKGDKVIWMIFFFLCIVSIIEVFSASSFLTYKVGSFWGPIIKHIMFILAGMITMIGVVYIPCKYFKLLTAPMLFFSFIMLIIVLVLGQATNGAQRWIDLGFVQFQPSEIAKGSLILAVAQVLSALQTEEGADKQAIWWVLGISSFIILPILLENFSTAMLISAVVFFMMFIGRVPMRQLGKLLGVCFVLGAIGIAAIFSIPEPDVQEAEQGVELVDNHAEKASDGGLLHRGLTWKHRFQKKFNSHELPPDSVDLDKDAQVAHANIAIVSSNIIGRGPGNSVERDFLSQAFSDFIYAIIIEEMGIGGAAVVCIFYVIIFFRVGKIANKCENTFPAYLAMGISLMLVLQAMFNMCVAVGIAPVTGQPLPLISKGGTSTIINCVYIGVLLSISKSAKKKQPKPAVATA